jgi:hypothetical protein
MHTTLLKDTSEHVIPNIAMYHAKICATSNEEQALISPLFIPQPFYTCLWTYGNAAVH